jgi:hypothetical protein
VRFLEAFASTLFASVALVGCTLLARPILGAGGEPVKNADGSTRVVYDEVVETGGGLVAVLTGNPLIAVLVGAVGALGRNAVVSSRKG